MLGTVCPVSGHAWKLVHCVIPCPVWSIWCTNEALYPMPRIVRLCGIQCLAQSDCVWYYARHSLFNVGNTMPRIVRLSYHYAWHSPFMCDIMPSVVRSLSDYCALHDLFCCVVFKCSPPPWILLCSCLCCVVYSCSSCDGCVCPPLVCELQVRVCMLALCEILCVKVILQYAVSFFFCWQDQWYRSMDGGLLGGPLPWVSPQLLHPLL